MTNIVSVVCSSDVSPRIRPATSPSCITATAHELCVVAFHCLPSKSILHTSKIIVLSPCQSLYSPVWTPSIADHHITNLFLMNPPISSFAPSLFSNCIFILAKSPCKCWSFSLVGPLPFILYSLLFYSYLPLSGSQVKQKIMLKLGHK